MSDRNYLHALIASLDELYEPRGIRIRCRRWEFFSAYYSGNRTQDDYNKIVRSSDMCICLFHKKAGEYTIEEFHQALDEFQSNKDHPKTIVYIRSLVEGEIEKEELTRFKDDLFKNLGHYWCNYANDDTMKLHFVMQLERLLDADGSANQSVDLLKVDNGIISLQGRKVADFKNIPFASCNAEYQALKDKYDQLDKDITQLRALGIDEGQDFLRAKVLERVKCYEEIQNYESQMLNMALYVNGVISSGNVISERKRLAIEMFEKGNFKGVIEVLNEADMALEAEQAEHEIACGRALERRGRELIAKGMQTINSQVEEHLLRAKALMLNIEEPNRFEMACTAYETAMSLSKRNLSLREHFSNLQKYVSFLWGNNQYQRLDEVFNEMEQILSQAEADNWDALELDLAMTQVNLGVLYSDTQRFAESEAMYKSAIEVRERLAKVNPSAYEPDLAATQVNLGILYSDTQRFAESEAMYKSAIEVRERLAKVNPSAYEPDLAATQVNLGILYSDTQRFAESEAMYKSAIEVYERLAKVNPSAYEPDLAEMQMNLGNLYVKIQLYTESEAMYKLALEVYERLAKVNPSAYEPKLAATQYNLGNLYFDLQRNAKSEAMYKSALEVYECLAMVNPSAYEPVLAMTQNNLAFISNLQGKFTEGEHYSLEALKVNPDNHLAYTNLAAALLFQGKVEEAEKIYIQYKSVFKDSFLEDFAEFERVGIIPDERKADVERIKAILNEE